MGCSRTRVVIDGHKCRSNNTNKWDAQEHNSLFYISDDRSNNTNKWDAQELPLIGHLSGCDQIIPINGMLKNAILVKASEFPIK